VHHRDLAELTVDDLARGLDAHADRLGRGCVWVHFEGRNPGETLAMMHLIRGRLPGVPISLEMEKLRPGGDQLLAWPDLLLFSRAYALALGSSDPEKFLAEKAERSRARHCVLAWGALGSYGWTRGGTILRAMPQAPRRLVDTLGAGDVFNAAVIDGLLRGQALPETLARANRLAGIKCGLQGLSELVVAATAAGFRGKSSCTA
jgi:ketohexokinase